MIIVDSSYTEQMVNGLAVELYLIIGGVLKSMLASDVTIIDVKEHHIKHF